ncbi:tetratricopeptide repeat protein [Desulfovibrio piger]|nr:tetratricopeptide repeat protein [Desulfovibrio piger]
MMQRPASSEQENPTLLGDLRAEVSAESASLLQFIVTNSKAIASVVLLLLIALAGTGIWRWHASSKAEEALDTLARTTLTTSGAERVAALEALAESSPAEFRFSVLSALARSAAEAGDLDRAAAAYGKAAQLEKGQPMGLAAELAQVGVLLRAGKGEDALKLLQALESGMAEESRLEMLPLVADAAEMAGKKDVAADAYDRLGKAYPGEDGSFYRARAAELGKK